MGSHASQFRLQRDPQQLACVRREAVVCVWWDSSSLASDFLASDLLPASFSYPGRTYRAQGPLLASLRVNHQRLNWKLDATGSQITQESLTRQWRFAKKLEESWWRLTQRRRTPQSCLNC